VIVMLFGFFAGTIAFCFGQPVFVWVSVGIIVVGLLLGWILAKAGYGVNGPKYSPKGH
jgi:membrane associated rhomboid family serine protease